MMNVERIGKIAILVAAVMALVAALTVLTERSPLLAAPPTMPVLVKNDGSSPVPVQDVDNPARHMFMAVMGCQIASGDPQCTDDGSGVVPSGSVFVIETVSARVALLSGQRVELSMEAGNSYDIPLSSQGTIGAIEYLSALTPVRMYVASIHPLQITAFRGVDNGTVNVTVNLTGYLLTQ